jgi:colicin import membrane protein
MMVTAEQIQLEKDQLRQALKISVALHLAILFGFTARTVFFTDEPIQFEQAIRVDMVGLPDRVEAAPPEKPDALATTPPTLPPVAKPAPPSPKTEAKPKTKEKDPEAINLDKSKSKQKQALEKLKQMDALEQIQKDLESENKKKSATKHQYKGNILAPGTALTGVNQLQADAYISSVHEHMMANWYLPEYLKNKDLRTDVIVKFDESGNILSKSIVKSSGNPQFDEFVLAAIQKSSPVPAPPEKFMRISSVQGFLFKFRHD